MIKIKIKPYKQHFEVLLNDDFYCTADTIREANKEAEQLRKLLLAVYGNEVEISISFKI